MISFSICIIILIAGYFVYGRIAERQFGPDDRPTPAEAHPDGVDYIGMKTWKVFLIQLLNIAGTGPIFGALSGAVFGPVAYLWITFGCVLIGGVHDYMCGMISMRNDGEGIAEIAGKYLGGGMKLVMRVFSVILLVMCGVVFTTGPAGLLSIITDGRVSQTVFLWIIIVYYFTATFLPIDKVIGKIYPVFGLLLIFMACGVGGSLLFSGKFEMTEIWDAFGNMHPEKTALFPFMFITIACGAVSGFHATQSPMMARCCRTEKEGRLVFYGAMLSEGIIALIWCAAGVNCYDSAQALLAAGGGCSAVVYEICQTTMGKIGSILAVIGVVVCPISSGDTAYRSARLTLADWFGKDQKDWRRRLLLTVPVLAAGALICYLDYNVVWRYCSWANQTLAAIALWSFSVYLLQNGRRYVITLLPAVFMTAVTSVYFFSAPECLGGLFGAMGLPNGVKALIQTLGGAGVTAGFIYAFYKMKRRQRRL